MQLQLQRQKQQMIIMTEQISTTVKYNVECEKLTARINVMVADMSALRKNCDDSE